MADAPRPADLGAVSLRVRFDWVCRLGLSVDWVLTAAMLLLMLPPSSLRHAVCGRVTPLRRHPGWGGWWPLLLRARFQL